MPVAIHLMLVLVRLTLSLLQGMATVYKLVMLQGVVEFHWFL
jgi:hypothetical protein